MRFTEQEKDQQEQLKANLAAAKAHFGEETLVGLCKGLAHLCGYGISVVEQIQKEES